MTRRQVRNGVLAFVLATGVALLVTRPGTALLFGLVVTAVVVLLGRLDLEDEVELEPERVIRRDGARGELQELAWAFSSRDGRLSERALRRLREVGTVRLARHGVALGDPEHADRARALVGDRAYATLTRLSHPLPGAADVRHTLDALERLGPTRANDHPHAYDAPEST
ncbi:hypothetical protein [Cellulomonas edaphi]|uniref:DUF4129 domain-containing protein n=1 Tax=Cellulomonas edaphi TaxID=3053468 RepID=A0ABT7S4X7_9CELL|nr:hypothetical protein [Cellulomons edaphi]MDM7830014.1 hypothetical protein [Cellulomons edaphi]